MKNSMSIVAKIFAVCCILAMVIFFAYMMVISPFISAEHYISAASDPLTVTATVTKHDSYDDDGDTDYRSYVSYTVNGTQYINLKYEDKDNKSDLTALDKEVQLQVSRKDPSKQISRLKNTGSGVAIFSPALALVLAMGWKAVLRGRRSKDVFCTPDNEQIKKDAKLSVIGRCGPAFWLLCGLLYGFISWRYISVTGEWVIAAMIVCSVCFLWRLIVMLRDFGVVDREEFELRQDVLMGKEIRSGEDSDSYVLIYRSNGGTWEKYTNKKYYEQAKKGDAVQSVFLPNKRKPLLHYDSWGKTC